MQITQRSIYILAVGALLVSSCQSSPALNISQPSTGEVPVVSVLLQESDVDQPNECLNCHSDKDRLIGSAKPEELAESESKGVG